MNKKIVVLALFVLVFFSLSNFSHGSGFLIYEHGAAAMAMGGAFVAIANNPTAIFHNPAGIAWLDGTQVSVGTTLITSSTSVNMTNLGESFDVKSKWHYPSTAYISHKISDRITAGFGFFTPYGLGLEWPNTTENPFPLRYIATKDDMKTFFFNPALAFKVNENFSVALGVSYIYSTLGFELVEHGDVDLPAPFVPLTASVDIPVSLEVSGSGWGLNAGALYKGENFSLGFNWRGGFKIDFDGDLDLFTSQAIVGIPAPAQPFITEEDIISAIPTFGTAKIPSYTFPHIFSVGAAFNLSENLMFSVDVNYILWSSYDEFLVDIDLPPPFEDKEMVENWKDSFILRGGFQYILNEKLTLRAGALYDKTPQPVESMDPILPDSDRWAVTAGFGYKFGKFVLDVAYQFEPFLDRTSPNRDIPSYQIGGLNYGEGTYSTTAHLIGISLGFNF